MLSPLRCVKHSPMLVRVNSNKSLNQGSESDTRLLETSFSTTFLSSSASSSLDVSTDVVSQENLCKEKIKKNVDKLGRLADRCELVNSNLVKVVDESHKILDNSFLAKQVHLTDHVTNLNYGACLDIGSAISTYSQVRRSVAKFTNPLFKQGKWIRRTKTLKSQARTRHAKLRQLYQLVAANFSERVLFKAC